MDKVQDWHSQRKKMKGGETSQEKEKKPWYKDFLGKLGVIGTAIGFAGKALIAPIKLLANVLKGTWQVLRLGSKVFRGAGRFIKGLFGIKSKGASLANAAGRMVGKVGKQAGRLAVRAAVQGARLLFTNPVGLAVIGIAAAGFAAYKLWKFFRDNFQEMDEYRLATYGLHANNNVELSNMMLAFEKEMEKEMSVNETTGYLTEKKIDYNKWAPFFWNETESGELSKQQFQEEQLPRFTMWYEQRFLPNFKRHKEAVVAMMSQASNTGWTGFTDWLSDKTKGLYDLESVEDGVKPSFVRMTFADKDKSQYAPDMYGYDGLPFSTQDQGALPYDQVKYYAERVTEKFKEDEARLQERMKSSEKFSGDSRIKVSKDGKTFDFEDTFNKRDEINAMRESNKEDIKNGNYTVDGVAATKWTSVGKSRDEKITIDVNGHKVETTVGEYETMAGISNNSVSNLQAMRFIAYGLLFSDQQPFDRQQMNFILQLEYEVNTKYLRSEARDKSGGAWVYTGGNEGLAKLWESFGTKAGFDLKDEASKNGWLTWLSKRFFPIYTGVLAAASKDGFFSGEKKLVKGASSLDRIPVEDQMDIAEFLKSSKVIKIMSGETDE